MSKATTTRVMTLESFLAEYAACRVWYVSVASPAGCEHVINTDAESDEDYCDSESLLNVLEYCGAMDYADELQGEVSQDNDGEYRWKVTSLEHVDARDLSGNTLLNLTVWGQ